jgi:hypothetical protein
MGLADLYRAALLAVFADQDRGVVRSVVIARGVEWLLRIGESHELPSERIRRENAEALRAMDALGNTPASAWKVAARYSTNPHTRLMYAQRFRRCRRRRHKEKKSNARLRKSRRARG